MKVAIVNYGMGNLGSVCRALDELDAQPYVAEHPTALFDANRLILPGVGAFHEGMARLREGGWIEVIRRLVGVQRKPLLGICLGMQMLAEIGEEGGEVPGLGFIRGRIRRLDALGCTLRIPHVGWNEVTYQTGDPLFAHIPQNSDFYFVHSYALQAGAAEQVSGTTSYGGNVVAAVRWENVYGSQFHPEKSSRAGRQMLRNFLDLQAC